jgi:hypothetical protein
MKDFIFQKQWGWKASGIALGIMFVLAVIIVKPIGVSTQFVILDGMIWKTFSNEIVVKDVNTKSGYSSPNAYLNKSGGKYAKNVANPLNYSFVFVIAMALGGFLASKLQNKEKSPDDFTTPPVWRENFGDNAGKRYLFVFVGGVLVLIGARLAGGCTSGHMMSGMMQTSISGYLFSLGVFATAIPVAIIMYRRGR